MALDQARQILRQNLSFARYHRQTIIDEEFEHGRRAALHAGMLSLYHGLDNYLKTLFEIPPSSAITDVLAASSVFSGDYRKEEIVSLMQDEGSWLNCLLKQIGSMSVSAKNWSSGAVNSDGIIASSSVPLPHWTELRLEEFDRYIDSVTEILERHAQFDQEC